MPLTEPTITANFSLFAPFGSGCPISGQCQLRGAFGSGVLPPGPDAYSQLLTKVRKMAVPFGDDEVLGEVELGVADLSKGLMECGARRLCQSPYAILHTTPHPAPRIT